MSKPNSAIDRPETTAALEDTTSATKPSIAPGLQVCPGGILELHNQRRKTSQDVRDGENVTLLGPSGCGKTIILRVAGGLEVPNEGDKFWR